jgi:hypothetical protein
MILRLQASEGVEMAAQFAAKIDRERKQKDTQRTRHSFSFGAHFRRVTIVVLSTVCRTWIPFLLLGALNRVMNSGPNCRQPKRLYTGTSLGLQFAIPNGAPLTRPSLYIAIKILGIADLDLTRGFSITFEM